ncbi:hypothetical protein RSAG8_11965, partial [Rhizoctonia solani AG-8 WAC10335]
MKVFTMCMPSLHGISNSDEHAVMTIKFKSWMKENLGIVAPRQVETAEAMVYPNLNNSMRPCLPTPLSFDSLLNLHLRMSLCTFFNYTARWQGHRAGVPWNIITKDGNHCFIRESCLPAGVMHLKKVTEMNREELILWYQWILDGQERHLRPDQVFQFSRLPQPDNEVVLTFPEPITTRPSTSNLTWTVEEKLYAWTPTGKGKGGLPTVFWGIVSLTFDLECYGPIHTRDLSNSEPLIPYLGLDQDDTSLKALLLTQTLPTAALLEDDPHHPDFSISTYIHWAKTNTRLRHSNSSTWQGGPDGVRGLIAVYIHISNAFSMYEHCLDRVPSSLVKAFDGCNFDRLKNQLVAFGGWLLHSLQESIATLKLSFPSQAQAWKNAVVGQYLTRSTRHTGDESLRWDTHGIPHGLDVLTRCYEDLQESSPNITMGPDNLEFRAAMPKRRSRAVRLEDELSNRDSTSVEEISLPGSDDMSDSGNEEENYSQSVKGSFRVPLSATGDDSQALHENNLTIIAQAQNVTDQTFGVEEELHSPSVEDRRSAASLKHLEGSVDAPTFHIEGEENESDESDSNMTNTILTDISPIKLPVARLLSQPRPHMRMEVVINMPCKRVVPNPNPSGSEGAPLEEVLSMVEDEGQLHRSIAEHRPRRSVIQDPRVKEFIRDSRKGQGGHKPE